MCIAATPDRSSVALRLTVTGVRYQLSMPIVPDRFAHVLGGVRSGGGIAPPKSGAHETRGSPPPAPSRPFEFRTAFQEVASQLSTTPRERKIRSMSLAHGLS